MSNGTQMTCKPVIDVVRQADGSIVFRAHGVDLDPIKVLVALNRRLLSVNWGAEKFGEDFPPEPWMIDQPLNGVNDLQVNPDHKFSAHLDWPGIDRGIQSLVQ